MAARSGHTEIYRGAEYTISFMPKLKVEVALPDDRVDDAIAAITKAARTGKIGDGKIFALDLESACACAPAKPATPRSVSLPFAGGCGIHRPMARSRIRPCWTRWPPRAGCVR